MGRGNQYIQLVKVLYCQLQTNSKKPHVQLSCVESGVHNNNTKLNVEKKNNSITGICFAERKKEKQVISFTCRRNCICKMYLKHI